jgi:hypothetical protein
MRYHGLCAGVGDGGLGGTRFWVIGLNERKVNGFCNTWQYGNQGARAGGLVIIRQAYLIDKMD